MENILKFEGSLVEMSSRELEETEGGVAAPLIVAAVVVGGALGLVVGVGVCYLAYRWLM